MNQRSRETSERVETHSTTILAVRHRGQVALGGDGQVTYGTASLKADTRKVLGENLLRVLRAAETVAERMKK